VPDTLPVEHLFDLHLPITIAGLMPEAPGGTLVVVQANEGTFSGPRLRGTTVGPGGDWATVRPDGTLGLDVRLLLRTEDGADILMTYTGVGLDGGTRIRTAPRFATGDERYAWLNQVQGVATGTTDGATFVDYQVYALA
jgi:hypothetical protein